MWDSETERIGKQRCTTAGYAIHVVSELIGFIGLLLLILTLGVLAWKGIHGTFHWTDLWLFVVPFAVGVISELLFRCSWWLALKKGFQYDGDLREASWMEAGERRSYKYPD
jgi:hypothetical protein